ncbi:hypothetical protein L7F22_001035 [Adiantum nelumboides]|nr:hypothetical protein [Adiantum nelumboides]
MPSRLRHIMIVETYFHHGALEEKLQCLTLEIAALQEEIYLHVHPQKTALNSSIILLRMSLVSLFQLPKMKDLGLLHHYLGIQFKQFDGGIALCQKSYIETLLCKFGLEDCKPIAIPMETGLKLSLHDAGDPTDVTLYQTAIGCLIYVCNTRPDIQFVVSQVSRFMHSPGSKHWQAVKRIFCYLSGTLHLGLFYPREGSLPRDLHAFSDSDWAGCFDTRVSTSGFCFMLGSSCISWLSKKQPTVATSSYEAEYRAVFTATVECVWLRRLMADLGVG